MPEFTDYERGELMTTIKQMKDKLDHLDSALLGNGNPEQGFIYQAGIRFERLENDRRWGEKFLNAFIAAGVAAGFTFLKPK